jgi:hypothetical protein
MLFGNFFTYSYYKIMKKLLLFYDEITLKKIQLPPESNMDLWIWIFMDLYRHNPVLYQQAVVYKIY